MSSNAYHHRSLACAARAAAAMVLLNTFVVILSVVTASQPTAPAGMPSPASAKPTLDWLAAAALAAQRSEPVPSGRYEFIHTIEWTDSTDAFARIQDDRVWWDRDGAMTAITTPLKVAHPPRGTTDVAHDSESDTLIPAGHPWTDYTAGAAKGTPRPYMTGPYQRPRNAAELTARLRDGEDRAEAGFGLALQLNVYYVLTPPERAAILTMLAGISELRDAGPTTDRQGRAGYAITDRAPGPGWIQTLVFDREGRLLAQYQTLHDAAFPRYPATPTRYALFITSARTDHRD